ncbi:MAG: hypothetical protein HPY69_07015 [Armatimonadetes bacterium]|nr:hypothetical protein [Armatimonadota bacterium]
MGKQLPRLLILLGLTQVVALGQVARNETTTRAPSAEAVLPPVSHLALTDFSIRAAQPTFTWQFRAAMAGTHTAAANWNSLPAVQLTLSVVTGR